MDYNIKPFFGDIYIIEKENKMEKNFISGITGTTEIVYNPSYETLFEEETKPELEGYEKVRKVNLAQSML